MSLHQVLPESDRLAYLEAMGVASWLPIDGQLDSYGVFYSDKPVEAVADELEPLLVDVDDSSTAAGSTPVYADGPADEPPPLGMSVAQVQEQAQQMRAELVADMSQSEPEAKPEVKEEVAPTAPVVVEKIAPLHLSISWYQCGVLVVNELPLQDGAAMSGSLAQLQTAMVNALGLGAKEVMPQTQAEFFWPLVPGPHGDSSKAGGTDALAYQLSKLLQEKSVTRVMLLGERSTDLIAEASLGFGQVGNVALWPEAKVLLTHSLHQLLKIPANKAEAWCHMQPLLASND
jgi:hypothetical protein